MSIVILHLHTVSNQTLFCFPGVTTASPAGRRARSFVSEAVDVCHCVGVAAGVQT